MSCPATAPEAAGRPQRLQAGDARLAQVLALIRQSFAFMDGRIDPPSSMHLLGPAELEAQCAAGEIWVLGDPPAACLFLTPRADCLYLSKLAVAEHCRSRGLARQLVEHAARRARRLGLPALELQTRVELVENHAAFARLGFVKSAETAHPGFNRPTSITMRRKV
ncbi:GNAT family N-acetyltransferase [Roseobacteraceae bacterium NS-SX3]